MSRWHLAQFNVAKTRYPIEDPRMAEFVDNLNRINSLGDQSPGCVWRYSTDSGHSMDERIFDCLLYTSPSPRDATLSRMPSSA